MIITDDVCEIITYDVLARDYAVILGLRICKHLNVGSGFKAPLIAGDVYETIMKVKSLLLS